MKSKTGFATARLCLKIILSTLVSFNKNQQAELTASTRARIIGNPKAETTIPVVKKYASSLQALLAASLSSLTLFAMKWGMGQMK